MLRKLLIPLAVAGLLATVAASPAAADDPILAVDIIATHTVVWDYASSGFPDACKSWARGSGTQTIRIHSAKRERVRLEKVLGNTLLTGTGSRPTFEGTISRIGKWKDNAVPLTSACTPCGPSSEFGPCDPNPQPPKTPSFDCNTRDLRNPIAVVSYAKGKGIPSIDKGLTVRAWLGSDDGKFANCPPEIKAGSSAARLRNPLPDWADLPKADLTRLTKLGVGDSVTGEVRVQRTVVDRDGKTTTGGNCIQLPDDVAGYSECAVTEYAVTFTRMS